MDNHPSESPEKLTVFHLLMLVLSIVVLCAILVDTFAPVPPDISRLLQTLDAAVCVLFFVDFAVRFWRAESKAKFMKWGWIDLIACIPNIDALRFGRLVNLLRVIRLLRGVRVWHRLVSVILRNKPQTAFASVLLSIILLITFSSVGILLAERAPEANIKSANDALWWSVTTITTVGYGDKYPVTMPGRAIAMVLMLSGIGLFGMLSGLIASLLLRQKRDQEPAPEIQEILRRLENLSKQLEEVREGRAVE